ncbi:hypothetical protein V2J09_012754 [Rumex salicifolius]
MGNTVGGSKTTTKIMNIKGETTKYKTPIQAKEVIKDRPGYELLESGSVRAYGTRAKPIDPGEFLEPKKVYFLVEQPKSRREPRRVMSLGGIQVGAQERLEKLVMTRRSVSDLSVAGRVVVEGGPIKLRLPKAEVERVVRESRDHKEAAEKILSLCMAKTGPGSGSGSFSDPGLGRSVERANQLPRVRQQLPRRKSPLGRVSTEGCNSEKRVGFFLPVNEGDIRQVAVAS